MNWNSPSWKPGGGPHLKAQRTSPPLPGRVLIHVSHSIFLASTVFATNTLPSPPLWPILLPFCCSWPPKASKIHPKTWSKIDQEPFARKHWNSGVEKLENHGQLYIGNMKVVGFPSVKLTIRKNSSNGNKLENEVKSCSFTSPKSIQNQWKHESKIY